MQLFVSGGLWQLRRLEVGAGGKEHSKQELYFRFFAVVIFFLGRRFCVIRRLLSCRRRGNREAIMAVVFVSFLLLFRELRACPSSILCFLRNVVTGNGSC